MVVNIGIIPETEDFREDKMYISDIFVSIHAHTLLMNIDSGIIYNGRKFDWPLLNCTETTSEKLIKCSNNKSSMTGFQLNPEVTLRVKRVLHIGKKYFNFYIDNFTKLSKRSSGLLGNLFITLQRSVFTSPFRFVGSRLLYSPNIYSPNTKLCGKLSVSMKPRTKQHELFGKPMYTNYIQITKIHKNLSGKRVSTILILLLFSDHSRYVFLNENKSNGRPHNASCCLTVYKTNQYAPYINYLYNCLNPSLREQNFG